MIEMKTWWAEWQIKIAIRLTETQKHISHQWIHTARACLEVIKMFHKSAISWRMEIQTGIGSQIQRRFDMVTWGCGRGRPYWRRGGRRRHHCNGDRRRPISRGWRCTWLKPRGREWWRGSSCWSSGLWWIRRRRRRRCEWYIQLRKWDPH